MNAALRLNLALRDCDGEAAQSLLATRRFLPEQATLCLKRLVVFPGNVWVSG
jgi:hypothetical protein